MRGASPRPVRTAHQHDARRKRMRPLLPFVALVATLALVGAGGVAAQPVAEAKLAPTQGNKASGTVSFTQMGNKVRVVARVSGLTPGSHGFHVHDKGDCSAPDAMSAGGHFNPGGKPHGHPHKGEHHAGDMPMLVADNAGNAELTTELTAITVSDGPASVVGRAVVVHADPDDFTTQPTGNSGARVACGVVVKR
jgi:Cu-Zn family superoxide dismutase